MSNLELKRKIGKIWPAKSEGRKLILLYHSIGDSVWSITKSKFSDQISWLYDYCRVRTLDDLIHCKPEKDIQVALTFDDGYANLHRCAASILQKRNMNATVYINTGWIGENKNLRKKSVKELGHYPEESFLIWSEIQELISAGWQVGSHGVNHLNLTRCNDQLMFQEVAISKYDIEMHLNMPCIHFAYTWGKYSNRLKSILKKANYQYAMSAYHGTVTTRSDTYAFPRMNISKDYTLEDFKNIIKGRWDYLGLIQKMKGI